MKSLRFNALLLAGSLAAVGAASAGGYSRGTADTDLLFEEGNFNMRASVTVVAPQRGYDTLVAPPLTAAPVPPPFPPSGLTPGASYDSTDGKYSQLYAVPNVATKFNITDDLRCVGTYTQSFGADSVYGPQAVYFGGWADGTGTMSENFTADEFGATCAYKFDLSKGRLWVLGGGFLENFQYSQTVQFNGGALAAGGVAVPTAFLANGTTATLSFDGDYEPGYRVGVAYEIPEIALRAQLMYRSEVQHNPGGDFSSFLDDIILGGAAAPATGSGTLPMSLELKLQSGVAPGWLAFGSVKWTDWSVLETLNYTIGLLPAPIGGDKELEYYFRDGWTVTGGIGHAFSESISGVVGLTWDRGVSTTEDTLSDSYTAAAGVSFKDKLGGEVRFGGALTYLTAASVAAESGSTLGVQNPGASFGYTVDGDWVYALSAGYKIAW